MKYFILLSLAFLLASGCSTAYYAKKINPAGEQGVLFLDSVPPYFHVVPFGALEHKIKSDLLEALKQQYGGVWEAPNPWQWGPPDTTLILQKIGSSGETIVPAFEVPGKKMIVGKKGEF